MTDRQYYAKRWLNRMYGLSNEIDALEFRRQTIIASMGGVARYGNDEFSASSGNPTETKNIEYALLSEKIEEKSEILTAENTRTLEVIDSIPDDPQHRDFKTILIYRHVSFMTWKLIEDKINYSESRTFELYDLALDMVYDFIPVEAIEDENS
jgi:hypothetical protein